VYAYIAGSGNATEGAHLRKVDQTGAAGSRAMQLALSNARIEAREIDYVAAHGNSMQDYDSAETTAIKQILGRHAWSVPISSLKSMCGQAFAASSAMQVVAGCLTMRDQIIAPTINYCVPDPECDLDCVPNIARPARVRTLLLHAHSLGGLHSAMVLRAR
jgi:3-oxoacyl-[acyl-carrier-protein] synthase II